MQYLRRQKYRHHRSSWGASILATCSKPHLLEIRRRIPCQKYRAEISNPCPRSPYLPQLQYLPRNTQSRPADLYDLGIVSAGTPSSRDEQARISNSKPVQPSHRPMPAMPVGVTAFAGSKAALVHSPVVVEGKQTPKQAYRAGFFFEHFNEARLDAR